MTLERERDQVTTRSVPRARYRVIGWMVLVLTITGLAAWEAQMRSLGLVAGDLDDSKSNWAVERRRIAAGDHDGVAIVGGSRILFDTSLDTWQALTGRRPVQLALPGMSGQRFLADLAERSDFSGLVVIDVTPEQFFREGPGNPEFEGVLDSWDEQGPAVRFGHQLGQLLSRYLAFMDDQYALVRLIDQVNLPNRAGVVGPYLRPWKLSETYDDRQHVLWRQIETNERLREHAIRVWLGGPQALRPPPGEDLIARVCADVGESVARIRARGGDVVFVRPPSAGAYLERERRRVPRDLSWDRLLRESGAFGIHFEDYPDMQGLDLPELSHLTRESAVRFTRAYVRVLQENVAWFSRQPRARGSEHG